ncbi:hypothetical protein H5410_001840, partial [Solanum commersonii]
MLAKNEYSYSIRSSIYDEKFKVDDETTQAMAWISFPDLKPTYFVKYSIFSSASTIDYPKYVKMKIMNEGTKESRIEQVQGHKYEICISLHTELKTTLVVTYEHPGEKIENNRETSNNLHGIVSHQIIPEDAITNTIVETTLLKDTDTLIEDNEKDDGGGLLEVE